MPAAIHVARPTWEKDCLTLSVDIDGKTVRVVVTPDALVRRFGAKSKNREDLERTVKHEADLLALEAWAKKLVASGRKPASDEIPIDKDDVMTVSISEKILRTSSLENLVRQATGQLEEAIGAAAPRVTAAWDLSEDGRAITLRLTDPPDSIDARFELGQLGKDSINDDLRFIRLWGDLLRQGFDRQLHQLRAS